MKRLFAFTLILFTFFAANVARAGTTPAGSGEKTIVVQPASSGLQVLFVDRDNLMLIEFSSTEDRYSDGSLVSDGEYYAVVWTPDNATFGGFDEQGNAVAPSKVLAKVPFAENGGCPHVQIRIDGEVAKRDYPGGTWDVYLLDTRVWVDGGVVGFGDILDYKKFNGTLTSGFGFVKGGIAFILEAGLKRPAITVVAPPASAISERKRDGDWLYLTYDGTVPGVSYSVARPTPGGGGMPSTLTLSDPVYITYNVKYDADGGSPTPDEVTIGAETIPVQPTIGKLGDGEEPFVVGDEDVTEKVKAIPGLRYGLERGKALSAPRGEDAAGTVWDAVGESVVATETTVTLVDDKPPAGAAFYRVVVSAW